MFAFLAGTDAGRTEDTELADVGLDVDVDVGGEVDADVNVDEDVGGLALTFRAVLVAT